MTDEKYPLRLRLLALVMPKVLGRSRRPRVEVFVRKNGVRIERHLGPKGLTCFDGPAERHWDADGTLIYEAWMVDGKLHRVGGPAQVSKHGSFSYAEGWHFEGRMHRIDGPAETIGRLGGDTLAETWHFEGVGLPGPKTLGHVLGQKSDDEVRAHLERTVAYAPLLAAGVEPRVVVRALVHGVTSVEGITAMAEGAPAEWALAFEQGDPA